MELIIDVIKLTEWIAWCVFVMYVFDKLATSKKSLYFLIQNHYLLIFRKFKFENTIIVYSFYFGLI